MVHSQTHFGIIPLAPPPQAAAAPVGGGIFQNVFGNESYLAHPIFKIAIWFIKTSPFSRGLKLPAKATYDRGASHIEGSGRVPDAGPTLTRPAHKCAWTGLMGPTWIHHTTNTNNP